MIFLMVHFRLIEDPFNFYRGGSKALTESASHGSGGNLYDPGFYPLYIKKFIPAERLSTVTSGLETQLKNILSTLINIT